MENVDADIIDLLDITLSEEHLDRRIFDTQCLKSLIVLLELKRKRIIHEKTRKIHYPVHKIYEQENENINLQCEALKIVFLVIKNPEEEILQFITYLNFQLEVNNFSNPDNVTKIIFLLNEIILICKLQKMDYEFLEKMSLRYVDRLFFYIFQSQNSFKICMLSTVLPNYLSILDELRQLSFFKNCFLQCKDDHNLDVLCILFNYVDEKALLTNYQSVLFLDDFWKYIENCISSNISGQQKQAIYLLKKCVQGICDSDIFKCKVPYLQVTYAAAVNVEETLSKLWQNFFILLDASKEKQLHLIWPSMTLLGSMEQFNNLWQICIYKKLLAHTQSAIVYFVASHILHNNIFFPTLNKYFLAAINKNDYAYNCINMFTGLPNFCNNINVDDFLLFIKDILEITWVPTAAWCFFSNMFNEKLKKTIPFTVFGPIYKLLKQLPHVYIRNGCTSIFLNYFVRNYNWKINSDDVLKLLSAIKDHDNDLFTEAASNYVDVNSLNNILLRTESISDIKEFEVFVLIIKILKCENKIQNISGDIQKFNKKLQIIIFANLFEHFKRSDIEKFILEQITELDDDCVEMVLMIIKKLQKFPDTCEVVNSKMLYILHKSSDFNKSVVSIALGVILNSYNSNELVIKQVITDLKSKFFENGKTDDDLCAVFLDVYFLTEEYPEVTFLDDILNNQSDIVISKMFQCLSTINFHTSDIHIVYFLGQAINVLLNLTKSKHFKSIILNYINCIFSVSFLQTVYEIEKYHVIMEVTKSLLSLSDTFPIIDFYMSEKIKKSILSSRFSKNSVSILMYAVVKLLLKGIVIKKEDRVEYYVCQEVCEKLGNAAESPNFIKTSIRMSSVESMLYMIPENSECAHYVIAELVKIYRTHFNKRYFPDSQIHLQKLRIVQALLTICPFIKSQRQTLIDLIEESFCTEVHQPCVKQLMQWLLFSLLNNSDDGLLVFKSIKAKIDTTSKTQPSTIAAFIVVLLHLTLNRKEWYWSLAIEALIPWSMGANFKLRVYSQAAIKKLLEEGKQRHYENFLEKFSYLEESILSVIKASGSAFYETLKSDELFFFVFEPDKYYSLETIYVDIPKLNGVTRTEWENVLNYKFITHKSINTYNENRSFSNSVTKRIENNMKERPSEDLCENTYNIQRKIDPWKNLTEWQGNSKEISEFILIASLIDKPTNLGGLSRTCEVFGVKQLVLHDIQILNNKEFKSLSMSSEDWVNTIEVKAAELKKFICEIRSRGYSVIGAEQTSDSVCLDKYKFNKKTALVLGNEKEGIPPDIIPILDGCIEIPQFGMVRSLNVHVAGATFIWEYAKQHIIK